MAFEPGGYADKLGNRYEGRWIVKQLLRLLNEEIRSVTVQAVGDDEHGVDLIIRNNDGVQEYQQCKARNGSKESWNVVDLNLRGIFAFAKFQLDRGLNNKFTLISGIPGTLLEDIGESARKSNGNPEDFYKYQIKDVGKIRLETFETYCKYNNLNPNDISDRAIAFDYLKRTYIISWSDDQNGFSELAGWASILIDGQPEVVIAFLTDFAQDNMRKTLVANDVWLALCTQGFNPRRLANDKRVAPAVQELQTIFKDSIEPILIENNLICRNETKIILNAIDKNDLIILYGAPGYGKSGVLYELTEALKNNGNPYIPIRLDRQEPQNTPKQFGLDIGLPASPVSCLESLTSTQTGVLILDQLDALRWTSVHSRNALDVCKTMIRDAINLKKAGKPISVIVSCRTFDLQNDPEIKQWLENNDFKNKTVRIEVELLSDESVGKIVDNTGISFSSLSNYQKLILRSIQHLAMWVIIRKNGGIPKFQSGTQLMRTFWKDRYQRLSENGVNGMLVDSVLDAIVDYMEENGKIYAPRSLISDEKIYTELNTLGIIRTDCNRILFWHQSYLDFRIADRLLRHIHKRQKNIINWLGPKEKQSLFRREQLKQVLLLLCDEDPDAFLANIKDILASKAVRFHLKHLTLEIIGQIEHPSQTLCEYLMSLFLESYWQSHIMEAVFLGKPQYVQFLMDKNIVCEWLDSDNQRETMLWLLRTVSEKIGDQVSNILSQQICRGGEWPEKILGAIGWQVESESDSVFHLRIQLARMGVVSDLIFWSKLAKERPMRAIQLIEAALSTWDSPSLKDNKLSNGKRRSRFEEWYSEDMNVLKNVASSHAFETWDLLMPHIERLTSIKVDKYDDTLDDWLDKEIYKLDRGNASLTHGIPKMVCVAGCMLAKNNPRDFLKRSQNLNGSISPVIQEILMNSYASLPIEYSDHAIGYLLDDTQRFEMGTGYREPKWALAQRLIEVHSAYCSEELFRKIENAIIYYHSPNEKRNAEYWLKIRKEGCFRDFWGRTQYFLLPALCPKRRSEDTNGLIGVLQLRYAKYSKDDFLYGSRMTGGWVGSPLDSKKLHKISDKAWLGIINNKKIPISSTTRLKQIGPDRVAESTISTFAHDLGVIAKCYPERFGKLALKFPKDVHPAYLAAILDGIKAVKPGEMSEDEKSSWEPATVATIEKIFENVKLCDDYNVANNFCWLMSNRATENWSNKAIDKLLGYAISHPNPEIGKLNVRRANSNDGEFSIYDLEQNSINCIRGVAALAIGELLWEHPDLFEKFKLGLEHLVNDFHPAVRVSSLDACMPVLNINKDLAVELFLHACRDELKVAASRHAIQYFNYCVENYVVKLSPIIIQMMNSEDNEIAESGAKEVCARWIFYGLFEKELEICKNGSTAQKKGVAEVAAHFLCKPEFAEKCKKLLEPLFNDKDKDVRQKSRNAFYNKCEILNLSNIHSFTKIFIKSQAFVDDPTGILYTFKDYPKSLVPFSESIFTICEQFVGPLADLSKDPSLGIAHDVDDVSTLILRLYEQSKDINPEIMNKCLDMWDMLFEHKIGYTRDMLKAIDN